MNCKFQSVGDQYSWKQYRVLYSDVAGKPFYYDTISKTGSWAIPEDLTCSINSDSRIIPLTPPENEQDKLEVDQIVESDSKNQGVDIGDINPPMMRMIDKDNNTYTRLDSLPPAQIDEMISSSADQTQGHTPTTGDNDPIDSWSCNSCTYLNEYSRRVCEMCGDSNKQVIIHIFNYMFLPSLFSFLFTLILYILIYDYHKYLFKSQEEVFGLQVI